MDASKLPKGQSKEKHTDGRPYNQPGIYVHKDLGTQFITSADEELGSIQADALFNPQWENAWEWKGEVPSKTELLEMHKKQTKTTAIIEAPEKPRIYRRAGKPTLRQ